MGNIWVHNGTTWKQGVPSVSRSTGYVPGVAAYRRPTPTTWSLIWQRDTTPPPPPTVSMTMVTGTRNKFNITMTTPNAGQKKFLRAVVKVGINKWSTSPTANDGTYYSEVLNGEAWSNWFTASLVADNTIDPGETGTKQFPAAYQTSINLPLNADINVSAWVQDVNLNWSVAATTTMRTLKVTDAPAGMQVFRTAIHPHSWDTWHGWGGTPNGGGTWLWRQTPNGVVNQKGWVANVANPYWWNWQGGNGGWIAYICFDNRLRDVMNTAYEVLSVKMPMTRRWNAGVPGADPAEASGVPRGAIFRIWANKQGAVPAIADARDWQDGGFVDVKTNFSFGETEIISIPEQIWRRFLNGKGTEKSITFYAPTSVSGPVSTVDPYDISYVLPGITGSGYRRDRNQLSGIVIIEWVGYENPWPQHTPGAPGFYPLGWSNTGPYAW